MGADLMTPDELYDGLVRLCQAHGFTTEHTYELLHQVVESISTGLDDDAGLEEVTCTHCGRSIVNEDGRWIDPEASGDDAVWRETCDEHDTFTAEHEPAHERDHDD